MLADRLVLVAALFRYLEVLGKLAAFSQPIRSLEEELPVLDFGYALNLYSRCGKFGLMLLSSGG